MNQIEVASLPEFLVALLDPPPMANQSPKPGKKCPDDAYGGPHSPPAADMSQSEDDASTVETLSFPEQVSGTPRTQLKRAHVFVITSECVRDLCSSVDFCATDVNTPQLMQVLCTSEYSDIISWLCDGRAFIIKDKKRFLAEVLPKHFRSNREFRSFTRKLERWGFLHNKGVNAFFHEMFRSDKPELCCKIRRETKSSLCRREQKKSRKFSVAKTTPKQEKIQSSSTKENSPVADDRIASPQPSFSLRLLAEAATTQPQQHHLISQANNSIPKKLPAGDSLPSGTVQKPTVLHTQQTSNYFSPPLSSVMTDPPSQTQLYCPSFLFSRPMVMQVGPDNVLGHGHHVLVGNRFLSSGIALQGLGDNFAFFPRPMFAGPNPRLDLNPLHSFLVIERAKEALARST